MTTPSEDGWHFVGKHRVRFEPPDVILLTPDGDMTVAENRQIMAFVKGHPLPEAGFFALINASKGGRADPAAMKDPDLVDFAKYHRAIAYFGASFHHRTLISIFMRIAKHFKGPKMDRPLHIFQTEAEARAWIDRERLQGASAKGTAELA